MKIGLNATYLSDRPSGAKQRFIGIYNELFKRMPNVLFTVYQSKDCELGKYFDSHANVEFIDSPIPDKGRLVKFLAGLRFWRKVFKTERFDLFEGYHLPFTASNMASMANTAPVAVNRWTNRALERRVIAVSWTFGTNRASPA